jgi:hypothetical protein
LFLGGLLPRPLPEGFPVVLGPFGGVEVPFLEAPPDLPEPFDAALLLAADWALAANDPLGTLPQLTLAVADWIRDAAVLDICFGIISSLVYY